MSPAQAFVAHCERLLTGDRFAVVRQRSCLVLLVVYGLMGFAIANKEEFQLTVPSVVGSGSLPVLIWIVARHGRRAEAWWPFTVVLGIAHVCSVASLGDRSYLLLSGHVLAGMWLAIFLTSAQLVAAGVVILPLAAYSAAQSGLLGPGPVAVMAVSMVAGVVLIHGVVSGMQSLAGRLDEARAVAERAVATDPLTGVASRRELNRVLRNCEAWLDTPLGLVLADLDHFKQVNDSLGHLGGDQVLADAGAALQAAFPGAVVARWGGEEFAVLTGPTTLEAVMSLAESARLGVRAGGATTVSLGVTLWQPGTSIDDALRAADQALYRAKAAGRDTVRGPQTETAEPEGSPAAKP